MSPLFYNHHILLLSMPGESEWLLILLVFLLFFGGKKIPELMKGIGRGIREFSDAKQHLKDELDAGMKEKDAPITTDASTGSAASSGTTPTASSTPASVI